ncbi:hypothetical protein C5167_045761 [Papaver somniferum]|uniref:RING-type domain-containing protein n=1 Tax=Papaver somniferum TaxID=3469 RepID=A0A4Y7LBY0_PAPSO|nr:E3 ubiquitin-protein ligase RHF1A-like isoform X2 [Papaver somniferum]RZC82973.1 hypothetical protein C5167_045761 [Papaver somniferum]
METVNQSITISEKEEESSASSLVDKCTMMSEAEGICSICMDNIVLQETALIKGCEHAYCVTCILRWATYAKDPCCPQCKLSFEFLLLHRSIDGSIHDYMFEESICLLLRAPWFKPLEVDSHEEESHEQHIDIYDYQIEYDNDEDDDEYLETMRVRSSSNLRIGNRMWGDNGFVRGGRVEARPVNRSNFPNLDAGPSRGSNNKNKETTPTGRRAKRALKREAADRAAAAKNLQSFKLSEN